MFNLRAHPLKDGFTHSIHLATGNQKLIAEVRGESNAFRIVQAPDLIRRLLAVIDEEIEQRKHGGNGEDWADLQALSDEGHALLK